MQEIIQQFMSLGSGLLIGVILSLAVWAVDFLKSSKFDFVASSTIAFLGIFLWSVKHILGVGIIHANIHDLIRIIITMILGFSFTTFMLNPFSGKQLFQVDFQKLWYNNYHVTKSKSTSLNPEEIVKQYTQMEWKSLRKTAYSRGISGVSKLKKAEILLELLIKDLS
jgi:hypothetical protein